MHRLRAQTSSKCSNHRSARYTRFSTLQLWLRLLFHSIQSCLTQHVVAKSQSQMLQPHSPRRLLSLKPWDKKLSTLLPPIHPALRKHSSIRFREETYLQYIADLTSLITQIIQLCTTLLWPRFTNAKLHKSPIISNPMEVLRPVPRTQSRFTNHRDSSSRSMGPQMAPTSPT